MQKIVDQLDDIDALHGRREYNMPTRHDAEAVRTLLSYLEGKESSQRGLAKDTKNWLIHGMKYFQATTQKQKIS